MLWRIDIFLYKSEYPIVPVTDEGCTQILILSAAGPNFLAWFLRVQEIEIFSFSHCHAYLLQFRSPWDWFPRSWLCALSIRWVAPPLQVQMSIVITSNGGGNCIFCLYRATWYTGIWSISDWGYPRDDAALEGPPIAKLMLWHSIPCSLLDGRVH